MMTYIDEGNFWVFLILTIIMGGGSAYLAGRSLAKDWRPMSLVFIYMALLAAGIRFLHYALFQQSLTSLPQFLITYCILLFFCILGYRTKRTKQMVKQYPWKYQRAGFLMWREKN